jgi:hypothetical protein
LSYPRHNKISPDLFFQHRRRPDTPLSESVTQHSPSNAFYIWLNVDDQRNSARRRTTLATKLTTVTQIKLAILSGTCFRRIWRFIRQHKAMSSDQGNTAGSSKDVGQSPINMSTPTSPTDSRHPLSRFETATNQNDGLAESHQSTDTIRRKPEPMSYGVPPHSIYLQLGLPTDENLSF